MCGLDVLAIWSINSSISLFPVLLVNVKGLQKGLLLTLCAAFVLNVVNFTTKNSPLTLKKCCFRVYLSPHESSESGEVVATNQLSGLSLCSDPNSETKTCLIVDTARGRPVPNHALKAFKFLSRSPEAQVITNLV